MQRIMAAFEIKCDICVDIVSFLRSFFKALPSFLFCLILLSSSKLVVMLSRQGKEVPKIPIDTSGGSEKEYGKLNHKDIEETFPNWALLVLCGMAPAVFFVWSGLKDGPKCFEYARLCTLFHSTGFVTDFLKLRCARPQASHIR